VIEAAALGLTAWRIWDSAGQQPGADFRCDSAVEHEAITHITRRATIDGVLSSRPSAEVSTIGAILVARAEFHHLRKLAGEEVGLPGDLAATRNQAKAWNGDSARVTHPPKLNAGGPGAQGR